MRNSYKSRFVELNHLFARQQAQGIKRRMFSMGKIIPRLLFVISITGAMALTTIYALAQETTAVIAEVVSCMFAAMICATLE